MLCGSVSNLKVILLYLAKQDFLGTFASIFVFLYTFASIFIYFIYLYILCFYHSRHFSNVDCDVMHFFVVWKEHFGAKLCFGADNPVFSTFFTRLSGLLIVLLGFDRMYHAKHLVDYDFKMTNKKLYISIAIALSVSLFFSAVLTFTSIYLGKYYHHTATTITCFDALLLTILLVIYLPILPLIQEI